MFTAMSILCVCTKRTVEWKTPLDSTLPGRQPRTTDGVDCVPVQPSICPRFQLPDPHSNPPSLSLFFMFSRCNVDTLPRKQRKNATRYIPPAPESHSPTAKRIAFNVGKSKGRIT